MKKLLFLLIVLLPTSAFASYGDTYTFLGQLYAGDNGPADEAYYDFPEDICADGLGNYYIADTYNNVIRKVDTSKIVTTAAGTGSYGDQNGATTQAEFSLPKGVACDDQGNVVVADTVNNKIKKIKSGQVTTIASDLNAPEGVAIAGNYVYILDTGNNSLKKVSLNGGTVSTITTKLNGPKKLDVFQEYAYIANSLDYQLVKVNLSNGSVSVVAGDGVEGNRTSSCERTEFREIWGVAVRNENEIYVSDGTGNILDTSIAGRGIGFVIKIDLSNNDCITTVFDDDKDMVSLNFPNGIDIYQNNLYVASTGIGVIYRYNLDDGADNEKFSGNERFGAKDGSNPLFGRPKTLVAKPKNKYTVYMTDNNKIRTYNIKTKKASFIAGNVVDNYPDDDYEWVKEDKARFSDPRGLAVSKNGKWLYVADRNNNRIRIVNLAEKSVGYLTGAGNVNSIGGEDDNDYQEGASCPNEFDLNNSSCAYFDRPSGLAIDNNKHVLYVADTDNRVIRKVYLRGAKKGQTRLVAGQPGVEGFVDGKKSKAQFKTPYSIALNSKGTYLYVADRDANAIRKIRIKDGKVTTVAGNDTNGYQDGLFANAKFSYPANITYKDHKLYVSEVGSQRIRMLDLELGVVKLVSGSGERGFKNGAREETKFNNPDGILAKKNALYVADNYNDIIRKIDIKGTAPYTDPAPEITSCSPQSLKYSDYPTTGYAMIEVKGKNFSYGTKAYLGSYALTTYVQSATSLAINVPIGKMAYGYYELKVTNIDGQSDKLIRAFSAQEYSGNIPNIDYWTD